MLCIQKLRVRKSSYHARRCDLTVHFEPFCPKTVMDSRMADSRTPNTRVIMNRKLGENGPSLEGWVEPNICIFAVPYS